MAKTKNEIAKVKRKTYLSIAVTFVIGIIFTILTTMPGPWDDWVEEKKEKRSGKK